MQIVLDFFDVNWNFVELRCVRSQALIFDIQIEDVEEGQTRTESIVEIFHPLVLRLRYLNIWIEQLNDTSYPSKNFWL